MLAPLQYFARDTKVYPVTEDIWVMFAPVKRDATLVGQVHQLLQRIKQLIFDGAACASGSLKYQRQFNNPARSMSVAHIQQMPK